MSSILHPTLRYLTLLVVLGASTPVAAAFAQERTLSGSVDPAVAPGEDFFGYANGAWLRRTTIPPGRDRWGARDEIAAATRAQVAEILDEVAAAAPGTTARKIADYRAALLDRATLDARGAAPLRPRFREIDSLGGPDAVARFIARGIRADVDPLNWGIARSATPLGLAVGPGINGETTNVPFLVQGGLGLPDRDDYLSVDTAAQGFRRRYRVYVERLFALAGFDAPADRAERVIALERALAETHATREASARERNADTLWTRDDFMARAPGIEWHEFFAAAGVGRQPTFVPWQPSAVVGLARLVRTVPVESWKEYFRFHALHDRVEVLSRPFLEAALTLRGMATTPVAIERYRADRALEATQLALGEGIGRLYAERHFPPREKLRVQRIVRDVVAAFSRRVERATWMSPAARAVALAKIRSVYVGVGYPEQWQDYSDLVVDPTDALGNVLRAEARAYRRALARLGRPVDRTEWGILPQQSGAVLIFHQNAYDFAAALLQPPKYDPTATEAATYGAIGAIIAHDVSHVIDLLGAEYDSTGRMRRWWTAEDQTRFDSMVEPLVVQYSGYRPFPDVALDGRRTRTENLADLTGLTVAFEAHRASLGARAGDREFARQQDREFFIAFAQGWRSRLSDGALRAVAMNNTHAPDRYRVATVRNLDAWYEAFDVVPGEALYLPPAERVRVW